MKRVSTRYPVLAAIAERWSPRSFADRAVEPAKLCSMFEAARLAPSAHNSQPARFVVTRRGHGSGFERLFACLGELNQRWAGRAPALILASAMKKRFSQAESALVPYSHFMHDLGLAVMSLLLQAQSMGLHCHPLANFDPDAARAAFGVPPLFEPAMVIAVGYLGPPEALPEGPLRDRELAARVRAPLEDLVFEGSWGAASTLFAGDA